MVGKEMPLEQIPIDWIDWFKVNVQKDEKKSEAVEGSSLPTTSTSNSPPIFLIQANPFSRSSSMPSSIQIDHVLSSHFPLNPTFSLSQFSMMYPSSSLIPSSPLEIPSLHDTVSSPPILTTNNAKEGVFQPEVLESLKTFLTRKVGNAKPASEEFFEELLKAFFAEQIKGCPVHDSEQWDSLKKVLELSILPEIPKERMSLLERVWSLVAPLDIGKEVAERSAEVVKSSQTKEDTQSSPTTMKSTSTTGKTPKTASTRLSKQASLDTKPNCSPYTKTELVKLMNRRLSKMSSGEGSDDQPGPSKVTKHK